MDNPANPVDLAAQVAQLQAQLAGADQFAATTIARLQQLEAAQAAALSAPPAALPALKPPKPESFAGQDRERLSVIDWTCAVTQYFEAMRITGDDDRLRYATCLLRGPALRWYRDMPEAHRPLTWADFAQRLVAYFIPAGAEVTARSQLSRLTQRTSVTDYTDRFRGVCANIPTMTDAEKKNAYTQGLKLAVKRQVAFSNPATFEEAVSLASRIDDILFEESRRDNRRPPLRSNNNGGASTSAAGGSSGPTPMELNAVQGSANTPRLAKLTDAERERLRASGACFRCRQPGHMSSQCPLRNQQGNGQRRRQ